MCLVKEELLIEKEQWNHSALSTGVQRWEVTESLEWRQVHENCKSLSTETFAVWIEDLPLPYPRKSKTSLRITHKKLSVGPEAFWVSTKLYQTFLS